MVQSVCHMEGAVMSVDEPFVFGANQVRVLGTRRDLFVEFEYIAGDPMLCVELVMPYPAFKQFCFVNDAAFLEPDADVFEDFRKLCFRFGDPPEVFASAELK